MKMRGGLLALLVLAIATVLMVFFVLPRLGNDTETKTEVAVPAKAPATTPEAKPAEPAAPAVDPAAATAAASSKMGRLMREADGALKNLEGLFASGKVPGADAFAAAKTSAESALSALAATDLPDGIDQGAADAITKARASAAKALDLLKALPTDPQAAGSAIAALTKALLGEEAAPSAAAATTPPAAPSQNNTETAAPAAPAAPSTETAAADKPVPKFDVLRVEPDGSTVIAGSAAPGTKVEIIDGSDKVLSSAEAGPTGDFAAVLDNPLPPGDHALALRSVDKSGAAVRSDEVATISVPDKAQGQLLAMISKPGEASRVITMPESVNTGDKQQRVAEQQTAAAPVATPDLPQASAVLSTSAPSIPTDATAAPASPATAAAPAAASTAPAEVQVTAVEIEGGRIFIAGTAPPSAKIRGYADDALVGEATADASRHFVIEGTADLAVGGHTIRVDLLDATGQVAVRASVPFDRPAGEQVAVVAPADGAGAKSALVPQDLSAFNAQRNGLSQAVGILSNLYADGKKPTLDALAAARSATELALKSLIEFRPVAEFAPTVARQVTATAEGAGKALAALQAVPQDVDAMGKALPQIRALIDEVLQMAPAAGSSDATAQAATAPAASAQTAAAGGNAETAAPKTIEQAPLTASRDSVIIRQGDTLWQISRRVYGQGVRYTTIYLANEGQITNPDKIAPGQIFSVPSEALPNAEELHRRRLRGEKID
ncbi:LysM domain-containing protein [Rhizobium sp. RU36D]|nr:Ig-like domain-containing protein [Rhizobium sp. RU36D]SMD07474.1 LysM domain-containing protein [Rhizobium sp. RU36D]